MKLTHKLIVVALSFGLLGGVIGGLTVQLLSTKRLTQRWVVVDTKALIQDQVAALMRSPGSEAELTAATNKQAESLKNAMNAWAEQQDVVLLNKTVVLSTLPDVTAELQAYLLTTMSGY